MRQYALSLGERLGKTQKEMGFWMDAEDLMEYYAYDISKDEKFIKQVIIEEQQKMQEGQSEEEEARRLGEMFRSIAIVKSGK